MEKGMNADLDKDVWQPKLVLGHNVSYDRSYIQEQYLIKVR